MEMPLARVAEVVEGEVQGDVQKLIRDVAPFDEARSDEITCAGSPKFLKRIDETDAGAVIVPRNFQTSLKNLVRVENPQVAFAKVIGIFHPYVKPEPGISPKAYVGEGFSHGEDVFIAPFAVIGDNVTVGRRVRIHANVFIGNNVVIGDDVEIRPNVTVLERSRIGNRVIIHAGTVIGSDGFGFAPDGETYYKIPHVGIVQIDDDVEIGALNAIDRATFGKTWIQKGVKTDNLVHIAHNVTVGENSVLVAQVGISGSVTIGKHAILAGQAGVAGHLDIGDNVTVGPQAGVAKSVSNGEVLSSGLPAMPHRLWLKVQRIIPMLPELQKRLLEVEKKLKKIEDD
ncbi:MAG: UDP-3-O-(3-hydroxymyristoyl)glucosamine N-acyltransferase [Pseudomonadota bacterium]